MMDFSALPKELEPIRDCVFCPRQCHSDRGNGQTGFCRTGNGFSISSICIHHGEEPVISGSRGICNIFFSHCNLQCIYCQNHQISQNTRDFTSAEMTPSDVIRKITRILDTGINIIGFVSPSHVIPQVRFIIKTLRQLGYTPTFVYNSNGYDSIETLRSLEHDINVYLPDLKYMDAALGNRLSGVSDYPAVASAAIREMFRQKGAVLHINDQGYAESGIVVRHLVLPGAVENSLSILRFLAEEISPRIHISMMAQYYPVFRAGEFPPLNRCITLEEYNQVIDEMEHLGLDRGFIQELDSFGHYQPDFNKNHPFEPD